MHETCVAVSVEACSYPSFHVTADLSHRSWMIVAYWCSDFLKSEAYYNRILHVLHIWDYHSGK